MASSFILRTLAIAAAGLALAFGAPAAAAGLCTGAAPHPGEALHGPVLHVPDGDTLCVARGRAPAQWVELRLAEPPLQKAADVVRSRGALMGVAFSQNVDCVVQDVVEGRAIAACTLDGQPIRSLAAQPAAIRAGYDWR